MKRVLLIGLLLALPVLANADTPQFDQGSNTLFSANRVASSKLQTLESGVIELGAIDYLKDFPSKFSNNQNQHNDKADTNASNEVPVPAAIPLLITAIALFGFGANRRRV